LSVRTVENHTARIYAKIGTRSRAEATAYAFRHSLL
ncbi:MAG: LuxR C-terminal-related transcriptional regulator, partial [Dehalococcoidia bacterium]